DLLSGQHWLEKLAARWPPELLICNSRTTEGAAKSVFPNVPSEIVHGPISFRPFGSPHRSDPPDPYDLPDRPDVPDLPDPPGRIVIAHVGRMVALKGHRI